MYSRFVLYSSESFPAAAQRGNFFDCTMKAGPGSPNILSSANTPSSFSSHSPPFLSRTFSPKAPYRRPFYVDIDGVDVE